MLKKYKYLILTLISINNLLGSDNLLLSDQVCKEFTKNLSIAMRWPRTVKPRPREYKLEHILAQIAKYDDGRFLAHMLNQELQPGVTWLQFSTYAFSSVKSVALFIKYGVDVAVQDQRAATPAQYLLYKIINYKDDEYLTLHKHQDEQKFDLLKKEKDRQDLRWLWIGLAQTGRAIDIKPITPFAPETIEVDFDFASRPIVSGLQQASTKSKCCNLQ